MKLLCCFFAFLMLIGCRPSYHTELEMVLKYAGANRVELEGTLNYYGREEYENLKYRAAEYLVMNAAKHSFKDAENIKRFDFMLDTIKAMKGKDNRVYFDRVFKKLAADDEFKIERKNDVICISRELLMEQIELSFEAWSRIKDHLAYDFETFCRYVLPYRAYNERPEVGSRTYLHNKYKWAYDSLKNGKDLNTVIQDLVNSIDMKFHSYSPPFSYTLKQIELKGSGNCQEIGLYLVNVLRALGIPSALDILPQWGDHHSLGHAWVTAKTRTGFIPLDPFPGGNDRLRDWLDGSNMPKVKRAQFDSNRLTDVTNKYFLTQDILFKPNYTLEEDHEHGLYVFNRNIFWNRIEKGQFVPNNQVKFSNIGLDNIYLPAQYVADKVVQIDYPFYLDSQGQKKVFKPVKDNLVTATIIRKYQPYGKAHNKHKKEWFSTLNGIEILGANDRNFTRSKSLATITNTFSSNPQKIDVSTKQSFKYYRLYKPGKSYLAEVQFILDRSQVNSGKIVGGLEKKELIKAVDGNCLSFITLDSAKYIGIEYDRPRQLNAVVIQARNDGNQIQPGTNYELFYWDSAWVSLGVQKAKDTLLTFANTPYNALLWLKCEKGIEEQVFTLDESGRQYWPLKPK